ncbi:MAG: hypothetical protein M1840_003066 [Geoglossum simile]|nr:MAG: hypothetical protein M1840_003066 [Geoglossum simile]
MESSTGLGSSTLSQLDASLSYQPISRELHAFCRLCPSSAAPRLLALEPTQLSQLSQQCRTAIDSWLCCDRTYEVMRDIPSLTTRDSTLPGKTKTRDGACTITGTKASACEVAHIVPYSIGKSRARATGDLWAVLRMFWGEVRTQNLQNLVFGPQDLMESNAKTLVNRLYNVLTMSPDAHTYWANGFFVLEPHPGDDVDNLYTQRAVFYWIYPHESSQLEPGVFTSIQLTDPTPPLSTSISPGEGYIGLVDGRANPPGFIQDGHIIIFQTDDPVVRPLPSRELLWLQAVLIRVLRMAGRAGWDMLEMNYSDSDVDEVRGDDEISEGCLAGNNSFPTTGHPLSAATGTDQLKIGPITPRVETALPANLPGRVFAWIKTLVPGATMSTPNAVRQSSRFRR